MRTKTLSPDALGVLRQTTFVDNCVALPRVRLARSLYDEVNEALEALGGKWNRKLHGGVHVFADLTHDEVAAKVRGLVEGDGDVVMPDKNPDAFFATPWAVVQRMLLLANGRATTMHAPRVLEPSAGKGSILAYLKSYHGDMKIMGVEMNELRVRVLREMGFDVHHADFLEWARHRHDLNLERFDIVLMNPPFSVERDKAEWIAHVRAAHKLLTPTGVLVAVVPISYEYRVDKKHKQFREDFAKGHGAVVEHLDPGAFKESGTMVQCLLLKLNALPIDGYSY